MTGEDLSVWLQEANFEAWESVTSATRRSMNGMPSPRVAWILQHLAETKLLLWQIVTGATGAPAPPEKTDLDTLMRWEVQAAARLTNEQLSAPVRHDDREFTVSALVRLNVRHSLWHAGQIAALADGPRLA